MTSCAPTSEESVARTDVTSRADADTMGRSRPESVEKPAGVPGPQVVEVWGVEDWRPQKASACRNGGYTAPEGRKGDIYLFLACAGASDTYLPAVPARRVPIPVGSDRRTVAVRALLTGPTAAERRAGFTSAFGSNTAGASFTVRLNGDTATVNFDRSGGDVAKSFEGRVSVAQLVATLGQFPEIRYVRVRVAGQPLCRLLDEC